MELANRSRIISGPGSSDISVRSYSADLLIVDEGSRVPDELYYAALPTLAKTGGRLIALSTPFGERGWWWHAWEREGDVWERYLMTAYDLPADWYEPSTAKFLATELRRMGRLRFNQGYLCSFEGTGVSIFPRALLEGAVVRENTPLELAVPDYWE